MTIRHLQIFIAVAETGSMSLAARRLFLSQPTVSQVIGEMEEEYGVLLFERLAKRLCITDAGLRLLDYARHAVSLFDEMEDAVGQAARRRQLRFGASITVGACVMTDLVRRFEEKNPDAEVVVFVDNTSVVEGKVVDSSLDFALVEGRVGNDRLVVRPVMRDELVLVCPPGHLFAGRKKVAVRELDGQPFLLRESGSGTREQLENILRENNVHIKPKWVCHSSDAILSAAVGGQGLAVLSGLLVREAEAQGKLCVLSLEDAKLDRSFQLIYHKNKYLSSQLKAFIGEIEAAAQTGS